MLLSEIIQTIRLQKKLPKTKVYGDLMSKKVYEKFENKNDEKAMRLSFIPEIANNLNISTKELIHFGIDSFKNSSEKLYDTYVPLLKKYMAATKKNEKESLKKEIIKLYQYSIKEKENSIYMQALYIMIKVTANELIDEISEPDTTDLIEIKKSYKTKSFYSVYDYKIFGNLARFFNYKDLSILIDSLYPVIENAPSAVIESSFLSLENLLLAEIFNDNREACLSLLTLINDNLETYPSYKHRLIYLQFVDLTKYLETLEFKYLFSTWNYIEIMAKADPSINLQSQKKALYKILEKRTGEVPALEGLLEIKEDESENGDFTIDNAIPTKIEIVENPNENYH